ncbi:MAG: GNAT family N-acetyltransferase [Candidatus Wallbacteria bacterium]|nr:GNAT family N-acetyltransferase [Candidatus Wallbacteria bacterium]
MPPLAEPLRTPRLLLRRWRDVDVEAFAAMSADPDVMRYFPGLLDRTATEALVKRIRAGFDQRGFGLWAVELPGEAPFLGYVGLAVPAFETHFTPCVEIGWRLAAAHWRKGYATEAAAAVLDAAFGPLGLREVVSFTVPHNTPSRMVMEKLGMVRDPAEDFEHPRLAEGHPLRRHVLYRIGAKGWLRRRSGAAGG